MIETMNLLVVRHLGLELGLVHLRCACHQMEVVLQPLVHLGCHDEDVRRHLLHRMTHNGGVMEYPFLHPWCHPWKWLRLE